MKICYFGTYDKSRPRNRIIIEGLKANGVGVIECHCKVWGGAEDKSRIRSLWAKVTVCFSYLWGVLALSARYLTLGKHDAVIVGYLGHFDMLLARPLTALRGKTLYFDVFLSLFDTVVSDRKLVKKNSLLARCCFFIDKISCALADRVLLDTDAHIAYFAATFDLPKDKFSRIFVGAEEALFRPASVGEGKIKKSHFSVLFYGQFIPLQGIAYIIYAAKLLEEQRDIRFIIIGKGQEYASLRGKADDFALRNIEWIDWAPYPSLPRYIHAADICLGVFGDTGKAKRVIPNKAFQAIASKKPLITGDSPAARELFVNRMDVLLCPMADPKALAEAIITLKRDTGLRARIAERGYAIFKERCTTAVIGKAVSEVLKKKQDA